MRYIKEQKVPYQALLQSDMLTNRYAGAGFDILPVFRVGCSSVSFEFSREHLDDDELRAVFTALLDLQDRGLGGTLLPLLKEA